MKASRYLVAVAALFAISMLGCESKTAPGVKSDMRSQWTVVNADTMATTKAAKNVLNEEKLKDVMSDSTNVDGKASAMKSDGTKVSVTVKKVDDRTSQVTVNVGMMGDSALGAEIARKIKQEAEGK